MESVIDQRVSLREVPQQKRSLTQEQEAALGRILSQSHPLGGRAPSRDELHERWAVAKQAGATLFLSEDMQHERELEGVRFRNPFIVEDPFSAP